MPIKWARIALINFILIMLSLPVPGCRPAAQTKTAVSTGAEVQPVVVYVVRHAEKAAEPAADPPLTERGQERAAALAQAIDSRSLVAVFATPFRRTRETVTPAAQAAGLQISEYPARDLERLCERIRSHARGSILVVGHSNTVPDILRRLGVEEPVVIADNQYGDLFVVSLLPAGHAQMQRRRFGDDR